MAEKATAQHFAETILVNAGFGIYGTTLFWDTSPDEKNPTVPIAVCYGPGGSSPSKNADRTHHEPALQIIVFGGIEDRQPAHELISDIRDYIVDAMPVTVVDSTKYYGMRQEGDIFSLGNDKNKRPQFSANFSLNMRRTP